MHPCTHKEHTGKSLQSAWEGRTLAGVGVGDFSEGDTWAGPPRVDSAGKGCIWKEQSLPRSLSGEGVGGDASLVAGEGIEGSKLGRHGELLGRAGSVDGRMATGGTGSLDGVRAVGRRRNIEPHSHGEETRLGFPYNGTPPTNSSSWV